MHREAFPSGLTLVVAERHATPVVVVQALVRAGPVHEGPLLGTGVSALVQRVLVNHATAEVRAAERRTGNQFSFATEVDYASYSLRTTGEHVEDAVRALALLLRGEGIDERSLRRERDRLLLEQESAAGDAERLAAQMVAGTVYQQHAARLPIIGRRDALLALDLSDIERYRRRRYTAPNVVLLVVGNIDTEAVSESVRSAFAYFPEGSYDRQPTIEEPPQYAPRLRVVPVRLPLDQVYLAWRTVPMEHPDQAVLPIVARLLDAPGSPLRQELEDEGRAANVQVRHIDGLDCPGYLLLRYEVRPEQRNEALKTVNEVVARLGGDDGASAALLQTIKLRMRREYLASDAAERAREFGRWELAVAAPEWGDRLAERRHRVDIDQIRAALATYLQSNRLSRVTLRQHDAEDNGDDRPRQSYSSVPAEVTTCDNGLRVVTQNVPRGLVRVSCSLGGAGGVEDEHIRGATRMLSRLLGRATEQHDAAGLREELDRRGMQLSVSADIHALHLSISCFPDDTEVAVALLAECLLQPVLAADRIELARQKTLERLALDDQLATWNERLWGSMRRTLLEGHYGASSLIGDRSSIGNLDREVLKQHLKRMLLGGNMVVTVIGGRFAQEPVVGAIKRLLGDPAAIPLGEPLRPAGPAWPEAESVQVQLGGDRDEAALGLAWRAPGRDDPLVERVAMDVLAAILGGATGRGGRFGRSLRQVGDGAVLESLMVEEAYDRRGLLMLSVLVAETHRDEVRKQIHSEMSGLLEALATEKGGDNGDLALEIEAAKAVCLTRSSLLSEDLGAFATDLAESLLAGDGVEEYLGYRQAVRAVTREQLLAMAKRHFAEPACRVQLTQRLTEPAPVGDDQVKRIIEEASSGGREVITEGDDDTEAVVVPGGGDGEDQGEPE